MHRAARPRRRCENRACDRRCPSAVDVGTGKWQRSGSWRSRSYCAARVQSADSAGSFPVTASTQSDTRPLEKSVQSVRRTSHAFCDKVVLTRREEDHSPRRELSYLDHMLQDSSSNVVHTGSTMRTESAK